jgi:2-phospho-L-lactate guanylyltransferase
MRVLAVPVKSLERTKTRLAPLLSPPERAALSLVMLEDVLDACLAQSGWEVWLISRAEAALEIGARRGARALPEQGRTLLEAIRQVEAGIPGRSSELAVLLADLPFLTAEALTEALSRGARGRVVAAPAGSDEGTNLLLRRPPAVIPAKFGRSSFARHRSAAYRAGVTFEEVRLPELTFDLDTPADLARVIESPPLGRTRAACLEMGLVERLRVRA